MLGADRGHRAARAACQRPEKGAPRRLLRSKTRSCRSQPPVLLLPVHHHDRSDLVVHLVLLLLFLCLLGVVLKINAIIIIAVVLSV